MDTSVLLKSIKKDVFGRQDIIDSAITKIDGFKETDIRNLLEIPLMTGQIDFYYLDYLLISYSILYVLLSLLI